MNKIVGIDVSKDALDLFCDWKGESFQFKNTPGGRKKLIKYLSKDLPDFVVLEATGAYHRDLHKDLHSQDIPVCVVNPKRVRDFAKATGILAKTDKLDAKVLARFGSQIEQRPCIPPTESDQALSDLVVRRNQLVTMITQEKNRLSSAPKSIHQSIKRMIKRLEHELEVIESEIQQAIESQEELRVKSALLQSVKGIGEVSAMVLLTKLSELGTLNHKQISSLAGVAPFNCESGKFKGKRAIYGGRTVVRNTLYMATFSATRYNPQIKEFYNRLIAQGKIRKVALTACMRKLLIILNAVVRSGKPWEADYVKTTY